MLNLDQVRLLENRVEKAVGKIQSLTTENTHLRSQLSTLQTRVGELEGLVRSFKDDQGRIEEGILNALDRLSAFEDSVFHAETTTEHTHTNVEPPVLENISLGITEPVMPADEEIDTTSAQLDIEAEWQNTGSESSQGKTSPDGQMDIF